MRRREPRGKSKEHREMRSDKEEGEMRRRSDEEAGAMREELREARSE